MQYTPPIPPNEYERLMRLVDFDLDYTSLHDIFKNLSRLAATICGTEISLINLIDSFTQWTVSSHGIVIDQMPREASVCQYTILQEHQFEVSNLAGDDRFKDKFYVEGDPNLRYYFGVPLKTSDGFSIGALCVMDKEEKELAPEKIEMLKIIADEVIKAVKALQILEKLKQKLKDASDAKLKVAHDVRGPISGIVGLAQIINSQTESPEDVKQYAGLIQNSGNSVIELMSEILSIEQREKQSKYAPSGNELNLVLLKEKLERLYLPQAMAKNIDFTITIIAGNGSVPFLKNKLLQVTGNLVSNAIKFTPKGGTIAITLELEQSEDGNTFHFSIKDSGVGIPHENIQRILSGAGSSTSGTDGEKGYGFGLALVKQLVDNMNGRMEILSVIGEGAAFDVWLPQAPLDMY